MMKKKLVAVGTIMMLFGISVLFAQTGSIAKSLNSPVLHARTDSIPDPLCGHTLVSVSDSCFILFGGDQSSRAVINELWAYNKDNSKWEKKEPDNPIPRRHRHASVKSNDKMITFFGEGLSGLLSDIWEYDPVTNQCTELPSGGTSTPGEREYHSATSIGNDIYICGGLDSDGLGLADTWSYNIETGIWTQKSDHP